MNIDSYKLNQVLQWWRSSRQDSPSATKLEKFLSIALRHYVIPFVDSEVDSVSAKEFEDYCSHQSVEILKDGMSVFEKGLSEKIKEGKVKASTGKNYRWAFNQFYGWLTQQSWWQDLWANSEIKVTPMMSKLPPQPKRKRGKQVAMSLKLSDLPESLSKELEEYRHFRIQGIIPHSNAHLACKPKLEKVKVSTYHNEENNLLYFWGYFCQQYPDTPLSLSLITDINLLDDFVYWVIDNRGVTHSTGINMTKTAISVCKFLNYYCTQRRNWSDIEKLQELRDLRNEYYEEYQEEKKQLEKEKWANKELTHTQAREVVKYLRQSCAERRSEKNNTTGERTFSSARNLSAVARAWQTYIMVKLMVYCPVRQEELRYLVYGESLLRKVDSQGNVSYEVFLVKHKLDYTGEPRHYRLPEILNGDLDFWIFQLLPKIRDAVRDMESWQKFWGYSADKFERLEAKIRDAEEGILPSNTQKSQAEYLLEQKRLLKAAQRRISAFPLVKANLEAHNFIFIMFGKHVTEAFGKPFDVTTVWITVRRAIAKASFALFGEAKWTNPHALRHIGEKHLRMIGKGELADAFGALIGHSGKMGAEYAAQITTELEMTEDIVDNWWLEDG